MEKIERQPAQGQKLAKKRTGRRRAGNAILRGLDAGGDCYCCDWGTLSAWVGYCYLQVYSTLSRSHQCTPTVAMEVRPR